MQPRQRDRRCLSQWDLCRSVFKHLSILRLGTCLTGFFRGGNWCPEGYDFSKSRTAERFRRMRDALLAQDRPILYSLCEWGLADVQSWGAEMGQSWRSTGDIHGKQE